MLNTLSSRATFYDVIGYLVPGVIAVVIGWLWILVFDRDFAMWCVRLVAQHGVYAAFFLVAGGYVTGHLVNSMSSLLLEKLILKKHFATAKQWYTRVVEKYPEKAKRIKENVLNEFDVEVNELTAFDMRIRMEESMPNATITGFSFLSFYGMNRTMALLLWLGSLPMAMLASDKYIGCCAFGVGGAVFIIFFFLWQDSSFAINTYGLLSITTTFLEALC